MLLVEMGKSKARSVAPAGGASERSELEPPAAGRGVEVPAKPERRRFSAEYKRRIVEQAERLQGIGEIGSLLRREGLYSSHLSKWRQQYRDGALKGLRDDKRGRKRIERNPLEAQVRQLEQDKARLEKKLRKAEALIDLQKKVAAILAAAADESEPTS